MNQTLAFLIMKTIEGAIFCIARAKKSAVAQNAAQQMNETWTAASNAKTGLLQQRQCP
ncbi:MAG TPA: hypothetical protein VN150_10225 [Ochrobactrum sp.]|nr:hypothetical protein [Ochrobactrum sp.]